MKEKEGMKVRDIFLDASGTLYQAWALVVGMVVFLAARYALGLAEHYAVMWSAATYTEIRRTRRVGR